MPIYQVRPGYTHGARRQYKAGDKVELTEQEAAGFLDKLVKVGASQPLDLDQDKLLVTQAELDKANAQASAPATPSDEPAEETAGDFDVAGSTIEGVLAAVTAGTITAGDALVAEQQSAKKRATLIDQLTKLTEGDAKGQ